MTRGQRRAHALAWWILWPLLAGMLAFALARRAETRAVYFAGPPHEAH